MMNSVKLSLMTAVALGTLVAFAPVSRAQADKTDSKPDQPAASQRTRRPVGNQIDVLAERLKLNDDQKKQLQPILREEAVRLREVREQYLAKMKPILTAEQFDQLKKMRTPAPSRSGPRGVRQGGDAKLPADPTAGAQDEKK